MKRFSRAGMNLLMLMLAGSMVAVSVAMTDLKQAPSVADEAAAPVSAIHDLQPRSSGILPAGHTVEAGAPAAEKTAASEEAALYIDDVVFSERFESEMARLVRQGNGLSSDQLKEQLKRSTCSLDLPAARPGELGPVQVYAAALKSTLVVGAVQKSRTYPPRYHFSRNGTAWVIAENVIATNRHVFDDSDREYYGVMTYDQQVYEITEVLASDKHTDVLIARINARRPLPPLPIRPSAPVGSWVGVLSHPGNAYFVFTQGAVTRYMAYRPEGVTRPEHWMCLTAEFALGSSGAPVLDRGGNVVGMATMTESVEYEEEKGETSGGSLQQMVIKSAVPASEILKRIVP